MDGRGWTPGPWTVDTPIGEDHPWINADCNHTLDENGDEHYLSVSGLCGMANAHLISAAPDLYEALERLVLECVIDGKEDEAGYDCWIYHARNALAKARGEK